MRKYIFQTFFKHFYLHGSKKSSNFAAENEIVQLKIDTIMKTKLYFLFAVAAILCACDTWEPNIPEGDNSLREHIEGTWDIKAYILPNGKQENISGNHSIVFGPIHNDTCEIHLKYVNLLESKCVLSGNNQIEILGGGWGGTDMYSLTDSGNEEKFLTAMNSVNSGYVRNDSLFLIIDSQKKLKYKAICFTR